MEGESTGPPSLLPHSEELSSGPPSITSESRDRHRDHLPSLDRRARVETIPDDESFMRSSDDEIQICHDVGISGTRAVLNLVEPDTPVELATDGNVGDPFGSRIEAILTLCQPFPGDPEHLGDMQWDRFEVVRRNDDYYEIYDNIRWTEVFLHRSLLMNKTFSVGKWYAERCANKFGHISPGNIAINWLFDKDINSSQIGTPLETRAKELLENGQFLGQEKIGQNNGGQRFRVSSEPTDLQHFIVCDYLYELVSYLPKVLMLDPEFRIVDWYQYRLYQFRLDQDDSLITEEHEKDVRISQPADGLFELAEKITLNGMQVDRNDYAAVQRNSANVKDKARLLPKPVVLKVQVQGHFVRALVDSGSQGDFLSTTLVDQLKLKRNAFSVPLRLQLAVQGSRSVINSRVEARFQFEGIDEIRSFDVINLNNYDVILGTPWLYQHKVCVGFNPARILVESNKSIPIAKGSDTKPLANAVSLEDAEIGTVRDRLMEYAIPICKEVSESDLPPLRVINHTIPLIDEKKTYPWRPSKCPEVFRKQWIEKRDAYLKSGRWEITSAGNTVPMLLIPNLSKKPEELQIVVDLREWNKNTYKMTSPMPDMEGMLRRAAKHKFRSALDLKSAYEQIRIVPEHVHRTAVTTPDGNMVSHVVQQGDCNAPATYQALMNHLFSAHIGKRMDVYLDDIIIYSDTLREHEADVKIILDILAKEKLYLSRKKLRFLAPEIDLLGHLITDDGIQMDPHKVDTVTNWKTPTNRDLLRGFLGSVGYLADDIPGVRIPMGILSGLTGDTVPFKWTFMEQRAFEDVKRAVHLSRESRRKPLDYSEGASPVWLITDGCASGISGVVSQGPDWKTARVAAFYSAKLNPAQQNYPVHEIEMLAGVETMLRHADILQGVKFKWVTDHKGLIHLLNQKHLSGRQARWMEKIAIFPFEVQYVPGSENVLADALSRMYSHDSPTTVRQPSEYTYHDVVLDDINPLSGMIPDLDDIQANAAEPEKIRKPRKKPEPAETGRPETGMEFAARMKDHFVLLGPRERKEGGNMEPRASINDARVTEPSGSRHPVTEEHELIRELSSDLPDTLATLPTLSQMLTSSTDGIDLIEEIRNKYDQDNLFQKVLENPKNFRNFEVEKGLIYLKEKNRKILCIPNILIKERSAREIVIAEAHSILAHLGYTKTLDYLRDHVWWKDMVTDTQVYCETCMTCQRSKPSNQKPYGLLNPLSIPGTPWEAIGVDFVGPLPESKNRNGTFDSITVVICLLTAMVHLIPSRSNYTAKQMAELMFDEIYKHHGIPRSIVSDRDVLFTSIFWEHLHKLLGTQLKMSSAYHPQTDGSTERAN